MIYSEKIEVTAVPPYSFDLSCEIFTSGDKQIRNAENGRFWQVIRVNGKLVLAIVASTGKVNEPRLTTDLKSDKDINEEDKKAAGEAIAALFSLDLDLKPFYETVKNDEVMAHLIKKLWGLKNPTTPTIFEAMADAIVEQQISLKVANKLENRLIKMFGDALNLEDNVYFQLHSSWLG
jgi:DNA-3-methyladenine glycosylase II